MIKRNGECPYTERIVGEENILENSYTLYIYFRHISPNKY